jgi:hypothetical protein
MVERDGIMYCVHCDFTLSRQSIWVNLSDGVKYDTSKLKMAKRLKLPS